MIKNVTVHVKYSLLLSYFNKISFSRQLFKNYSNTKFHKNPSSGSRVVSCGRTDLWTERRTGRHYEANSRGCNINTKNEAV